MYEIERLIKGWKIFGVKYLMLQRQLNGILYQLFSIPFLLIVVLCFLFFLDWNKEGIEFHSPILEQQMDVISSVIACLKRYPLSVFPFN